MRNNLKENGKLRKLKESISNLQSLVMRKVKKDKIIAQLLRLSSIKLMTPRPELDSLKNKEISFNGMKSSIQ